MSKIEFTDEQERAVINDISETWSAYGIAHRYPMTVLKSLMELFKEAVEIKKKEQK